MSYPRRYMLKFFGEKGLTPASANHVANLAKEYYRVIEKKLEGLSFCDTYIQAVACGERIQVRKATSESDFASIPVYLEKIGKAKALIAWLREAIKAHETLVNSDINMDTRLYGPIPDLEYVKSPSYPQMKDNPSEEDVIKDVADLILVRYARDMEEMSWLFASTLFHDKEKELDYIKMHPLDISRPQRQIYRAQCIPSEVIKKTFESTVLFYGLVERYGGWDSDKISRVNREQHDELLEEYWKKRKEASEKQYQYQEAYNARNFQLREEYNKHRIIIPDSLKEIYEEISLLGKKN